MVFLDQSPGGRGLSRGRSLPFPHAGFDEASFGYAEGEDVANGLAGHNTGCRIAGLLYASNAMGRGFSTVELANHHWTTRGISRFGGMLRR